MMHAIDKIDFLPESYRLQHSERRSLAGRLIVVGCAIALIAAASWSQWHARRQIANELARAEGHYEQAAMQSDGLLSLQSQLDAAKARAELLTYLRHPWPTTRVLAVLFEPLPESATLESVSLRRQRASGSAATRRDPLPGETPETAAPTSPAEASRNVLRELRQQYDERLTTVSLAGRTLDSAELHEYLAELDRLAMVARAQLRSLESVDAGGGEAFRFSVDVELVPGYGQQGGPRTEQQAARPTQVQ